MLHSLLLISVCALAAPVQTGELIFPVNPQHNHGSSLVETPEGDLLAVWFHGTGERQSDDVMLQGARLRQADRTTGTWKTPFVMADTPDLPDCNPVLFVDPRGALWLFWVTVQDNQWGGTILKYRTAKQYTADGPPQWDWQDVIHARPQDLQARFTDVLDHAEEKLGPMAATIPKLPALLEEGRRAADSKLSQRLGWMTRLHPIMTSDKRMMLGLYSDVFNCSLAAFTEDWGQTWSFSFPILDPDISKLSNIQPSFVKKKDGSIVAFMRDNGLPKKIRSAVSSDQGVNWSGVSSLDITNPGSSVECIALASGRWALICNDEDGRHQLTVYLSDDEGATWPHSRSLERVDSGKGNFSYPSMIQTRDGMIHCTYSYSTEGTPGSSIKHAAFNEEWITTK